MSIWKCENKDCKMFDVEDKVSIEKIIVINGEVVSDALKCPECGEDRVELNKGTIPRRVNLHGHNLSNS